MTTTDQTELDAAFALLREVVDEQYRHGRRCFSAGLKPAMQKRLPGFFEGRVGFTSFRQFLEAAAANRVVELEQTGGPDVNVVPPGARADATQSIPREHPRSPRWVRPDLWRAFFDWTPGLRRVYDPRRDRAMMFPEAPNPLEAPDVTAVRSDVESRPDEFVAIEPIRPDAQVAWMTDFANAVEDDALRQALHAALMNERPIPAFNRVVRADPSIGREWYARRLSEVEKVISEWQEAHGLSFPVHMTREAGVQPETLPPAPPPRAGSSDVEELRARLHAAIDRMEMRDLLRLIEYLIERR